MSQSPLPPDGPQMSSARGAGAPSSAPQAMSFEQRKQQALAVWSGLSLGGKVLLLAGVAGTVLTFLPVYSVSTTIFGSSSHLSVAAFDGWQGKVGLLGFLGCAFFGWYLSRQPRPANFKNLLYATLGCAAIAGLMTLSTFWDLSRGPSVNVSGTAGNELGDKIKSSAGMTFLAYLYLLSGLAALAGGGLRAMEEKLINLPSQNPPAP